jgi:putative transposase
MPSRNVTKTSVENGYYHVYNRGVEKRVIFLDEQDYGVFLSYLREYLLPKDAKGLALVLSNPNTPSKEKDRIVNLLHLNNFNQEISLLAYCLMPNHFHFLLKQITRGAMDKFMNSMGTRYTMYFNRKYKRVGPLYQGVYKAVLVNDEGQFLHLSRYIHKQALNFSNQPCSYPEYTGTRISAWIDTGEILASFSKTNPRLSYDSFVKESEDLVTLKNIVLEEF